MSDLINRQAAIDALIEWYGCEPNDIEAFREIIEAMPSAEPNIVRCKDCKWGTPHPEGDEYTKCFKLCTTFFSGHYCAWGKRKEDAENKEFNLYADKKPIVTFKDSKIILHGERREDEAD